MGEWIVLSVKGVTKPKRKYSLLKKDLYIETTTNPSRETKTQTHTRHHISGILKPSHHRQ